MPKAIQMDVKTMMLQASQVGTVSPRSHAQGPRTDPSDEKNGRDGEAAWSSALGQAKDSLPQSQIRDSVASNASAPEAPQVKGQEKADQNQQLVGGDKAAKTSFLGQAQGAKPVATVATEPVLVSPQVAAKGAQTASLAFAAGLGSPGETAPAPAAPVNTAPVVSAGDNAVWTTLIGGQSAVNGQDSAPLAGAQQGFSAADIALSLLAKGQALPSGQNLTAAQTAAAKFVEQVQPASQNAVLETVSAPVEPEHGNLATRVAAVFKAQALSAALVEHLEVASVVKGESQSRAPGSATTWQQPVTLFGAGQQVQAAAASVNQPHLRVMAERAYRETSDSVSTRKAVPVAESKATDRPRAAQRVGQRETFRQGTDAPAKQPGLAGESVKAVPLGAEQPVANLIASGGETRSDFAATVGRDSVGVAAPKAAPQAATVPLDITEKIEAVQKLVEITGRHMLRKIDQGGGTIRMRLDPPELGRIRLEINVKNDVVRAEAVVEHIQAKQILNENVQQLKDMLSEKGLDLQQFDVYEQLQNGGRDGLNDGGEFRGPIAHVAPDNPESFNDEASSLRAVYRLRAMTGNINLRA
ncbi:MAG: flagellar hook-length control protein FliK [Candidatus Lernaella stagnicola]|nr:flagellar hook-length control protein FliK [Candidatus Lernaella stagnicola]